MQLNYEQVRGRDHRPIAQVWSALGFRFRVPISDPVVSAHVGRLFDGLTTIAPGRGRPASLQISSDPALSGSEVLDDLVSQVNLRAIGAAEGNLLFHAGAVGDRAGRSMFLCGPSGSGKSTLTVRLVEDGHTYLTDETVCLNPDTLVLRPYRKPVSLKSGSQVVYNHLRPPRAHAAGDTWLIPPSDIDAIPLPSARWLPSLVVFPTFLPGAGLQVNKIAPGEAAFLLGQNSSRLSRVRGGALPALSRVARRVEAFRIVHDDLDAAAGAVQELWAA